MRAFWARLRRVIATTAALGALAAVPAALGADSPASVPASAAEGTSLWFVEMPSPPTADGTSLSIVQAEQASFRSQAKGAGLKLQERYSFKSLWNGVSVRVTGDASALSLLAGVKAV